MIQSITFFEKAEDIPRYMESITTGKSPDPPIELRNTWDDWHILPTSRPVFTPPEPKTTYVDIPGGNGALDLSESLTGYPTYNDREGEFTFRVMNDYGLWSDRYSEIMEYLHGRRLYAVLEDDPNWFYDGRFNVESWASGDTWSEITIGYRTNPFKWSVISSADDWLWDPFNFETGVIIQQAATDIFRNSPIAHLDPVIFGYTPVSPYVTITNGESQGVKIKFENTYLNIVLEQEFHEGTTFVPDFVFYGQKDPYVIQHMGGGSGIVSLDFRSGRL